MLDYEAENPGVLRTAVSDMSAIAAEEAVDLPRQWAEGWARTLRDLTVRGATADDYDPEIVGAIIVGAISGAMEAASRGADRKDVIANTVRFLVRALEPREEGPSGCIDARHRVGAPQQRQPLGRKSLDVRRGRIFAERDQVGLARARRGGKTQGS